MNSHDKAYFRTRTTMRIEELSNASVLSSDARKTIELDQQSVGRLSRMDAIQNKAIADAADSRRRQEIMALPIALKRLEEGDFGYCFDCGEIIERARLETNPALLKCRDCAMG